MTKPHLLGLVMGAFAVGFALPLEARTAFRVYVFDWVEPKWGGHWGNFTAWQSVIFLLAVPCAISALMGAILAWPRITDVPPGRAARRGLLVGCVFAVFVAAADVTGVRYPWLEPNPWLSLVVLLIGPAVVTWAVLLSLARASDSKPEDALGRAGS